jgi:hypothetical protein
MKGKAIPGYVGSNPQSGGNKAAKFLKDHLVSVEGYVLEVIPGAGYPDFILKWDDGWCCAEAKSTSKTEAKASGLRMVLTGSTGRLRNHLDKLGKNAPPPCHLLYTLQHDAQGVVTGMRLDFLEPDSKVNVKLEASMSGLLLAHGRHHRHQHPG